METQANDYNRPPKDKAELLARIEGEWEALEKAFTGLSDQQMSVPDSGGWSIKDNLAHLTAWERFMRLSYLHKKPAHEVMGIDENTFKQLDENGVNAVLFQRNQHRRVAEVLAELRKEHGQVLAELANMTFEQMLQPLDPNDPQKRPVINWIIGNTYEHYREHRATIEKFPGR
jgi:hypothetical protein